MGPGRVRPGPEGADEARPLVRLEEPPPPAWPGRTPSHRLRLPTSVLGFLRGSSVRKHSPSKHTILLGPVHLTTLGHLPRPSGHMLTFHRKILKVRCDRGPHRPWPALPRTGSARVRAGSECGLPPPPPRSAVRAPLHQGHVGTAASQRTSRSVPG